MPTYLVRGADRETGENRSVELEAPSEPDAELLAQARGILVSKVIVKVSASEMRHELVDRQGLEVQRYEPPKRRTDGHDPAAAMTYVNSFKPDGSLGIAAVLLGAFAIIVCWLPYVNQLGLASAAAGFAIAILGFLLAAHRRGSNIGFSLAGGFLCLVAGLVSAWIIWFVQGFVSFFPME